MYVLATLHPLLVPGAILIFDEFCVVDHEFKAFRNYATGYMVSGFKVLGASWRGSARWTQMAIQITGDGGTST